MAVADKSNRKQHKNTPLVGGELSAEKIRKCRKKTNSGCVNYLRATKHHAPLQADGSSYVLPCYCVSPAAGLLRVALPDSPVEICTDHRDLSQLRQWA
jgi:hypothetical protein